MNELRQMQKKGSKKLSEKERLKRGNIFLLIGLLITAFLLRTLYLGNTFQSADNAALADRIVHNHGYAWMVREYYGFLINFIVKIFVATFSLLGIKVTEFWWKLPIALVGSAQVLLTFFFLKRWFKSLRLAFSGAAFLAILPVHVMQSRYLWGYEVLGIFFLTIFIWQWLNFLEKPSLASGRRASLALAFYLISHGYILPLLPAFILSMFLLPEDNLNGQIWENYQSKEKTNIPQNTGQTKEIALPGQRGEMGKPINRDNYFFAFKARIWFLFNRFRTNFSHFLHFRVWLYPLLFSPLTAGAFRRTQQKRIELGFYLGSLRNFIENTGIFLSVFILTALLLYALKRSFFRAHGRNYYLLFFLIIAGCYLLPFFVAIPPGVTVVRGYQSMGIYWLVLFSLAVWQRMFNGNLKAIIYPVKRKNWSAEKVGVKEMGTYKMPKINEEKQTIVAKVIKIRAKLKSGAIRMRERAALALIIFLFLITGWGTVETIFFRDRLFDPALVKVGRGDVSPDPGTKAAGYLFFKYLPEERYPAFSVPILVLHRQIEPPCVSYYWRRAAIAFYDYSFDQTREAFLQYKDKVSLIVADSEQVAFINEDPNFEPRIILYSGGQPRLFIYSRDKNLLPLIKDDVKEFNRAFDRELSPRISFK